MALFFTADTHFGDPRALRFDHRPFADLTAHDEALIRLWNETASADDEVWHLGDFALGHGPERIVDILQSLNGRKHLIVGNNDGEATLAAPGWESVQQYRELDVDGRRLVLCHYPFRTWNGIGKGAVNLHGHSHGRLKGATRQYDVGVDVWEFRPVALAAITERRRRRQAGHRTAPGRATAGRSAG